MRFLPWRTAGRLQQAPALAQQFGGVGQTNYPHHFRRPAACPRLKEVARREHGEVVETGLRDGAEVASWNLGPCRKKESSRAG